MTTPRPSTDPNNPHGATPVGARDRGNRRKRGLLLGALLVGLLILAALLLSQCGSDDPEGGSDEASRSSAGLDATSSRSSGSAGSSSPSASPSAPGSAGAGAGAGAGGGAGQGQGQIVTAGGESVLELAAGPNAAAALGALDGEAVTGTAVQVLSVPADEGFWVGSSDRDRVWIQLTGEAGESPYQVTEGDTVNFEGTVVRHDASFAGTVGVDEASGAAQLTEQAAHIEVAKGAVALAG